MKEIINVLIKRDGMCGREAEEFFNDVMAEVYSAIHIGDFEFAEYIFESSFGLEPEYLMEVLC